MKAIKYIFLVVIIAASVIGCNHSKAKNNSNNNLINRETMKFEKVALPYATDALEPVISKAKMCIRDRCPCHDVAWRGKIPGGN